MKREEKKAVLAIRPEIEDLWFKEQMMADEKTMAYNARWGGTIPFDRTMWPKWYSIWMDQSEFDRFYRYLVDPATGKWIGEIAYRYDQKEQLHFCDIIVLDAFRHQGYGQAGLKLLCRMARENGVSVLVDDIAADNPSYRLFLKVGFEIVGQNDEVIRVRKAL